MRVNYCKESTKAKLLTGNTAVTFLAVLAFPCRSEHAADYDKRRTDNELHMTTNRLAHESSAYLKSAAHQPINWHPWGDEPFRLAARQNKPVLLDIGAVWCHWCHVMDRESYEDPEVAAIINDRFIAVKVDRDERPEVDRRYQGAVGAITGQGGWPLTAFLTDQGQVFYGGTYFPKNDMHGRPGYKTLLARISDLYRDDRNSALENARKIKEHLGKAHRTRQRKATYSRTRPSTPPSRP